MMIKPARRKQAASKLQCECARHLPERGRRSRLTTGGLEDATDDSEARCEQSRPGLKVRPGSSQGGLVPTCLHLHPRHRILPAPRVARCSYAQTASAPAGGTCGWTARAQILASGVRLSALPALVLTRIFPCRPPTAAHNSYLRARGGQETARDAPAARLCRGPAIHPGIRRDSCNRRASVPDLRRRQRRSCSCPHRCGASR